LPPWTCLSNRTGETEPMNPEMAAPRSLHFETLAELASPRLDQSAASEFELFTRSQYKQRVLHASINGRPAKASSTVRAGDRIAIEYLPEIEISMEGQDIPWISCLRTMMCSW
jgi:23S rRNA-/tRNA-specific pseudouridylate synthase